MSYKYGILAYMWKNNLSFISQVLYSYGDRHYPSYCEAAVIWDVCIDIDNNFIANLMYKLFRLTIV